MSYTYYETSTIVFQKKKKNPDSETKSISDNIEEVSLLRLIV